MSEFRTIRGFEDVWRPPVGRRRTPETVLGLPPSEVRAKLVRVVRRAPEVMVKVTGRTRDAAHLKAHLDYVSRNGALDLEDREGWLLEGSAAVRELAADWSAAAALDSRRRSNTPISLALVLSMPAGTDPYAVRDAARSFCAGAFGDRFDYVFALHTDEPHPHVHVTVRCLGPSGERLNPKKAALAEWRELFAACLRELGVEAEATPRRARGVSRKAERGVLRRIGERAVAGRGPVGRVQRALIVEAARTASMASAEVQPWEKQLLKRRQQVRAFYLGQARLLQSSTDEADRRLGIEVEAFVREMPAADTQRLVLARELRSANERKAPEGRDGSEELRDRSRNG